MTTNKYLHVLVENELTGTIPLPAQMGEMGQSRLIAAFMSNPTFVISEAQEVFGSMWDGEKFTPPAE